MDTKILNYRIIIDPEKYVDGSKVYTAYCPTLGVADYGDSVEEVIASIKQGIELAVESLARKKQIIPTDSLEEQIITSAKISLPAGLNFSLA